LLDLCYEEDFRAQVDFNIAMTSQGDLVEIQATAEGAPFSRPLMEDATSLAQRGIESLLNIQSEAIESLKTL